MSVEYFNQRRLIKMVPDKWKAQYPPEAPSRFFDSNAKLSKILSLDLDTCTAADVDNIIGNSTWTQRMCDCCDFYVTSVIVVDGRELCINCADRLCKELRSALDEHYNE